MQKIVLLDGHSILNRAFYGVPDLTNAKGFHTNAIYGFLNIMFKILEEEKPEYLAVAFDDRAPTFRHAIYKEYKGTRKPMPTELREQVPVMMDILTAMNVSVLVKPGIEADDILGTIAKGAESEGMAVSIVSGDRDLLQIASDIIKIRIPKTKGGKTEIEDYYADDVKRVYQVTPREFIDVKALMGDSSDNIPGVPKIGAKTATDLIVRYGSVKGVYEHLEEVSKASIKESLSLNKDLAELSRELATISTDAETGFSLEKAKIGDFYTKEAYALFKELEFKNYLNRFDGENFAAKEAVSLNSYFHRITDLSEAEAVFASLGKLKSGDTVGIAIISDSDADEDFVGVSLAVADDKVYYFPAEGFVTKGYLVAKLWDVTKLSLSLNFKVSAFDLKKKYDYLIAPEHIADKGLCETACFFDILIAAYLLNPLKNDYEADDIASQYLDLKVESFAQLFGKMSLKTAAVNTEIFTKYACTLAYVCYKTADILQEKLVEAGMRKLFTEIEMPLSYVLHDMEKIGILVRPDELKLYGEALAGRIEVLEKSIYEQAGSTFNINSPKQLGEILFEQMKLPGGKKTKTGYSTAADVLERLAGENPIVGDILEYRGLAKLKSTYADGLSAFIKGDNRIHTNLKQTITATGRLSSTDPNLQNIPMRTEHGRLIRKVFIPTAGTVFVDADYSQIELRILAHLSGDEQLIEAYRMEEDIHRITAAKVFHTPFSEVTDLQRRNAKAVNFGIVYGISSFGLSQDLTISRKEAESYIEQYFATYPKVKEFLTKTVETAKEKGFVTTMFGRLRPIPELLSSNFMQRSFGERVAMNSPIQGTAADIIKIAMIRVWDRLKRERLRSRLVLQIHDELLLEAAEDEVERVKEILFEEMPGAAALLVELEIDLHTGENWYVCK
ncbi:MAG: DNA polymerase I [Lachnospiraceae bacterium]|nr:DNA polymerase I [Lachnospiraceae bacterium]